MTHLKAAIFDMDGVVTNTAEAHFQAWENTFNKFLQDYSKKNSIPYKAFTKEDYLYYVDGIPRLDGVKRFLSSRNISLSIEEENELGSKKNFLFQQIMTEDGIKLFSTTINFINKLRDKMITTAIISSSKNCLHILKLAEIESLFDICIDGNALELKNLPGKPQPDIFLEAAQALRVNPNEAVILEDAILGTKAGRAGNFGLVVGIDRNNLGAEIYEENGADIVVKDLSELSIDGVFHWFEYEIKPIFESNGNVSSTIKFLVKNNNLAFFLDFDGTLTPIYKSPDQVILKTQMRDYLKKLSKIYPVAIISGREIEDLKQKVQIDDIFYIGNHGLQIEGPSVKNFTGNEYIPVINKAYHQLMREIGLIKGILIENKKLTLSIHYRLIDESSMGDIHKAINSILIKNPTLMRREGKKLFEIHPKINWDKGKAIIWLLPYLEKNHPNIYPIAIGDDKTDEDSFKSVKDRGLGIIVTNRKKPTAASYSLLDPNEVEKFIRMILNEFA